MKSQITINREEELAKSCAERWKNQYWDRVNGWGSTVSGPADTTYRQILAAKANPRKIKRLDLKGWIWEWCDGCHDYKNPTITISNYDDDSNTYCAKCIKQMAHAIHKHC